MMIGGSRFTCPVDGCDWQLDPAAETGPVQYVMPVNPTSEDVFAAVQQVADKRAAKTEAAVREHAVSHDVLDFLRTIMRLQQDLYQQDSGIRPHVYRAYTDSDTPSDHREEMKP